MPEEIGYNAEVAAETTAVPESAFCRSLRSKKYFMMDAALATDAAEYMDASNHCWCFRTQQVVGPDGGKVHPTRCGPARSCYRSAFE
ncbi:MAG TPA: hypothetical protein VEQ42_03935 [Pyrinomonadaceae bacterium]|nr:hypothetical protein [Pyrinomonadaceae bacterium]